MDRDELGARFWLGLIGAVVLVALGSIAVFLLLGAAWYSWGLVGTFIVFGGVLVLAAVIYDRRHPTTSDFIADGDVRDSLDARDRVVLSDMDRQRTPRS